MASWKKTITSPFRKACTFFNGQQPASRDKKSQLPEHDNRAMDLHGEVMACAYEDVQVMWSILDKSKSAACNVSS
ncbi:SsrA-binding [Melia azedarach]|nr:SsrA-binding [Melia azedarach]